MVPVSLSKAETQSPWQQLNCYYRNNTFILCRISKPTFITICSTTFVMEPSILHPSTKKILTGCHFFTFIFAPLRASVFLRNEADNS